MLTIEANLGRAVIDAHYSIVTRYSQKGNTLGSRLQEIGGCSIIGSFLVNALRPAGLQVRPADWPHQTYYFLGLGTKEKLPRFCWAINFMVASPFSE
jgi:hypothetical protein